MQIIYTVQGLSKNNEQIHAQMCSGRFYFTPGRSDFYSTKIYYIFLMHNEISPKTDHLITILTNIEKQKFLSPIFHEYLDNSA
jgi:hypothetical protein